MMHKTICMMGPEAAEVFYDTDRFLRSGAAPDRLTKTLFGEGGVQGLDDDSHRHRKQMFMSLMTDDRIGSLADLTGQWWRTYATKWASSKDQVVLYQVAEK
ncbi:MAG TPA: cytochrome P450, partial [Dehalococcoidia bacterium]|nr:cytochrome P450 [Dehalococcoidia bacterium]